MHIPYRRIGDYNLVKFIGNGPFTEVYLGQHTRVEEIRYAVKGPLQTSDAHRQLLQKRAFILSQLDHPAIVKVFVIDNAMPAIGLTFAEQGSLSEKFQVSSSLAFILDCTSQLADALTHAHSKSFAHGNLKPENILFSGNGHILLSDFDVPAYSPEQALASDQARRNASQVSDQRQLARLMESWLLSQNNSLQAPPEVVTAFQQILRKAQSPEGVGNYPNIQTFAQEVKRVAQTLPRTATVPARLPIRRALPWVWTGLTLFLLLILASGLLAGLSLKHQIAIGLTPAAQLSPDPQRLYQEITSTRPTLDNPQAGGGSGQWSLLKDRFGGGCEMDHGTLYLVSPSPASAEVECLLNALTARDFAFQVDMRFLQTDQSQGYMEAGLLLRTEYEYALNTGLDNCYFNVISAPSSEDTKCASHSSTGSVNTLTVIALKDIFYLYINKAYVTYIEDSEYQSGSLGVFLMNTTAILTRLEVSFTNVKVWTL